MLLLPWLAAELAAAAPSAAQTTTFRGTVLYEKIPAGQDGLRLDAAVRTPAAGIKVEIVAPPQR
ncbi:MAG TPA: hypothetical protein VGX50_01375, partial [Longimicrobium sp.]|nr:hypothetical protein [Longimicrobium sp.]